jgi:hypothetical protein
MVSDHLFDDGIERSLAPQKSSEELSLETVLRISMGASV